MELRRPEQGEIGGLPQLYHCKRSLVGRWEEEAQKELRDVGKRRPLELVSFHLLSRYEKNLLINGAFHGRGKPYSESELLENAARNVDLVRALLGADIPILVENNNHLGTDAYDIVTEARFIAQLVRRYDLYLLWDVAHSVITAINRQLPVDKYLAELPFERCLQVHLSRLGIKGGLAFDAHDELATEDWFFFFDRIHLLPKLRYATIEYYNNTAGLIIQIERLRSLLRQADTTRLREFRSSGLSTK